MTDQLCICGPYGNLYIPERINCIARLETIQMDWQFICAGLGIKCELSHEKASKHEDYRVYYNDETKKIVGDFYKDDLRIFGYEF